MEIADIFVVNKADHDGADRLAQSVVAMLALQTFNPDDWRPPILKTEATTGAGVPEVMAAIDQFRAHSAGTRAARRRERQEYRLRELLAHRFLQLAEQELAPGEFERLVDGIAARSIDPYSAATAIINRVRGEGSGEERNAAAAGPDRTKAILDHVGIAVQDVDKSLAFFRDALGLDVEIPEEVASQRVRAHFIPVGDSSIELLEATASDSAIAKYVEKRGPGIHHITLRVGDIRAVLDRLKARGVRLVDQEPRPGAEGSLVAFVHPSAAHGVLVELKEKGA
jgi:methylmalonyl-CoA/ethylmalonyl-CoA epimerase